jgi:hypothetical protein
MSEQTPSTALAPAQESKSVMVATSDVRPQTSRILQLALQPTGTGEKPRKLFEGWYEFAKPGYLPFRLSHLQVFTASEETLALVSNKPQLLSHREAAEQIVADLSLVPNQFLYLVRCPAGGSLCRDLVTAYLFEWEWTHGKWVTTKQIYCYRVSDSVEEAIQRLFQIDLSSSVDTTTVVENNTGA